MPFPSPGDLPDPGIEPRSVMVLNDNKKDRRELVSIYNLGKDQSVEELI